MKKVFYLLMSALLLTAVESVAGNVDTIKVHSNCMNKDIAVTVTYPTATKANKNRHYPVVYLLHGAYANEYKWLELKPNLPQLADEKEMIFVTPYVLNSWYFDSPINEDFKYETFVIKEVLPYIDAHYPTIADREHRGVTGLSMGGHGAFYLGIRHKEMFGAICSMSGGVDIRPFPLNWNIPDMLGEMASNRQRWDENTAMELVKQLKNHDVEIAFDCGESDFFIEVNKALHERLLSLGIDHDFSTRPGGHTDQYWANSLDYQLLFFQKYFSGEMKH